MPGVQGALPEGALIGFGVQCQAFTLDSERKNEGHNVTNDRCLGTKRGVCGEQGKES